MPPGGNAAGRAGARALTKLFPVEKLFRKAPLRKGDKVPGGLTTVPGIKKPPLTRKINQSKAWHLASKERDELHRRLVREADGNVSNLPRGKQTVITGVTDPTTGLSTAGHNFKAKGNWGCAEKDALDKLNKLRQQNGYRPDLEPHQVDFTNARAVRDLKGPPAPEMPICNRWCQELTRPEQYPDWVAYQSPGPWDNLLKRGGKP